MLSDAARKLDVLLWVCSVPLLPMILAEFFTTLSAGTQLYFHAYYFTVWFVFTADFLLRLTLARDKVGYLKTNWLDVLVVLTPAFRIFKVFYFMRLPVLLLSDRVLSALGSLGLNFLYYLIFVAIVVLVGADLVLFFEQQHAGATITTFGDAVWWAMLHLTTAGSGHELSPVSSGGKTVGVMLMTIGFALFSILIATLVSFFMKEYSRVVSEKDLLDGIKDQFGVGEILERLERIEKKLDKE